MSGLHQCHGCGYRFENEDARDEHDRRCPGGDLDGGQSERDVERLAEAMREGFREGTETWKAIAGHLIASRWLAERDAAIRDEAKAEALREFGNRMATPKHPGLDGPTLHEVWLEAQHAAALLDGGDQS